MDNIQNKLRKSIQGKKNFIINSLSNNFKEDKDTVNLIKAQSKATAIALAETDLSKKNKIEKSFIDYAKETSTEQLIEFLNKGSDNNDLINAAQDEIDFRFENDLLEKGGEGSKGGNVVGHTKSGKPIYDSEQEHHGHKFVKDKKGWNLHGKKESSDEVKHGTKVGVLSSGSKDKKARTGVIVKEDKDQHHVLMNDTDKVEKHKKHDLFNDED